MFRIIISLLFYVYLNANMLQDIIDKAPYGATLQLQNSVYKGNIIINKPLIILGIGKNVIIQGEDKDTVITINSSNVILKNLTITNSGNRIEKLDSAISLNKVSNCTITKCRILNSLYGIDMNIVNKSISGSPVHKVSIPFIPASGV